MADPGPEDLPTADDVLEDGYETSVNFSDSETDQPSDTPEDTDIADGTRLISADVSCENCAHKDVCTLLQGIAPMLESWQPGEPPIDLTELAVICDAYLPDDEVSD